jgi:long-chain fatty acid transport protein
LKSFRNALLAGGALLFVFAGPLFAAGFALSEYSARSNALAGAPLARADDPSALAYNPAGITQLEGIHLATGMTFIMPQTEILRFADGFSQ